jgi:hypothetical protein
MIPVGTEQHYKHLVEAIRYYEQCGFKWLDVPWAVSELAIYMTRPTWIVGDPPYYVSGGEDLFPVASAEQSFLQMQLDAVAKGERMTGSYVTMTPCFRNEPVIDELHQPYFMKVELISWDKTTREDMDKMIAGARLFFERSLWVDCVHNADPDPLGIVAYDLVTTHTGIELGSYGIREHPKVGRWVYGTGLAEPRFSYALEKEEPFNQKVEAFF